MNPTIKCSGCSCFRVEDDFIYGNRKNKSCVKCRDKRKKNRDKKKELNKEPNKEPNNEPNKEPNNDDKLMSFIRHQRMYKKLLVEYKNAVGHSVHMYNFKPVLSKIKDNKGII